MYTLTVKNNRGEKLELTKSPDYTVYRVEGLTPPQATVNSSVNVTTDGSNINSVRLERRNIVIYMTINGDIEANRIKLYKYFPTKKTVTLYFKNDTRDVYIEGTVELIECDLFNKKQVAQISIICPKPYFKAVDDIVTYFSDVKPMFEFPFSIPEAGVEFSGITADEVRKSIINTGDTETGLIISLFAIGEVVNPVIHNALSKSQIKLNMTLQDSDTVVINTNIGEKSITLIRNGVSSNALGHMERNSNWFTLEAGDNVFTYGADSGQGNLQITFSTTPLYGGV